MRPIGPRADRLRLLIVEEDRRSYDELRGALMELGYECEVALDMETARTVIGERRMGMAVVNVQMAEKPEEELIREFKEASPGIRLVFYNGTTDKTRQRRLRRVGADSYLSTASDLGAVVRAVERVFNPAG